jgi:hypothetical protein
MMSIKKFKVGMITTDSFTVEVDAENAEQAELKVEETIRALEEYQHTDGRYLFYWTGQDNCEVVHREVSIEEVELIEV